MRQSRLGLRGLVAMQICFAQQQNMFFTCNRDYLQWIHMYLSVFIYKKQDKMDKTVLSSIEKVTFPHSMWPAKHGGNSSSVPTVVTGHDSFQVQVHGPSSKSSGVQMHGLLYSKAPLDTAACDLLKWSHYSTYSPYSITTSTKKEVFLGVKQMHSLPPSFQ